MGLGHEKGFLARLIFIYYTPTEAGIGTLNHRWQSIRRNWRYLTALAVLALVTILNITVAQWRPPFEVGYFADTTVEVAEREAWIKGAPVILSKYFSSVEVVNVGEGVEPSFVFERTLAQIYRVGVDYSQPPIQLGAAGEKVAAGIAAHVKHESEIFCNYKDAKYCDLQIAWREQEWYPSPAVFVGVELSAGHFALVEAELLAELTEGSQG